MALAAIALLAVGCYKPFDLDGDDKADLVWIDSSNVHAYRYDLATKTTIDLGGPHGPPVSGDFDGDGKYELADIGSTWQTYGKTPMTFTFAKPSGTTKDVVAVPGKYDGGKKTLPAWYRTTDATWFVYGHDPVVFGTGASNPGATGSAGANDMDLPVPGDYDGDGTTDLATWSPRTGVWHIRSSRDGTVSTQTLGNAFVFPAPARWNGGNKDVPAVFHYNDNGYEILGVPYTPPPGPSPINPPLYVPSPGDYDGDGVADKAYVTYKSTTTPAASADAVLWTVPSVGAPISLVGPTGGLGNPVEANWWDVIWKAQLDTVSKCVVAHIGC